MRQLRQYIPLLVAVTGYAHTEHRRRCAQAGFDLVLAKPLDHERLQGLLADAARIAEDSRQLHWRPQECAEHVRHEWAALRARWRGQQQPTTEPGDASDEGS
jgi:hypothetical protein